MTRLARWRRRRRLQKAVSRWEREVSLAAARWQLASSRATADDWRMATRRLREARNVQQGQDSK